ncbi:MAG: carboxymuconolactone decarboxylase family protein [Candidatus Bathyarchaeota archaeon]|nr:MAG: carboxymuconolactone decarboxylase family protein [Candidatus Bathyarchaeota archaeon]
MVDLKEFNEYRHKMNERILSTGNLELQRFWALDGRVYEAGALDERTKELLGLATSTVLKCDDCVSYHVIRCVQLGVTNEELLEALNVALIVGGSITIPHIRRAVETIDRCRELQEEDPELKSLL